MGKDPGKDTYSVLRSWLDSRATTNQAIGILMSRTDVTPEGARRLLHETACECEVPVVDLAEVIVDFARRRAGDE